MPEKDLNQRFSTLKKMEFVAEGWGLSGTDFGRFLRTNGISSSEIESWRNQMADGINDGKPLLRGEKKQLEGRIERLEEELKKAHGIIEFQKKFQKIFEKEEAVKTVEKIEKKPSKRSMK